MLTPRQQARVHADTIEALRRAGYWPTLSSVQRRLNDGTLAGRSSRVAADLQRLIAWCGPRASAGNVLAALLAAPKSTDEVDGSTRQGDATHGGCHNSAEVQGSTSEAPSREAQGDGTGEGGASGDGAPSGDNAGGGAAGTGDGGEDQPQARGSDQPAGAERASSGGGESDGAGSGAGAGEPIEVASRAHHEPPDRGRPRPAPTPHDAPGLHAGAVLEVEGDAGSTADGSPAQVERAQGGDRAPRDQGGDPEQSSPGDDANSARQLGADGQGPRQQHPGAPRGVPPEVWAALTAPAPPVDMSGALTPDTSHEDTSSARQELTRRRATTASTGRRGSGWSTAVCARWSGQVDRAEARRVERELRRLVAAAQGLDGEAGRLDGADLVCRLVSRSGHLDRARRPERVRRRVLLLPDVSGSCSAAAPLTLRVAHSLAQIDERIVVLEHANGSSRAGAREWSAPAHPELRGRLAGVNLLTPADWVRIAAQLDVGAIVALGDGDAHHVYEALAGEGRRWLLWCDSYAASWGEARHDGDAGLGRRCRYYTRCNSADDFAWAARDALRAGWGAT